MDKGAMSPHFSQVIHGPGRTQAHENGAPCRLSDVEVGIDIAIAVALGSLLIDPDSDPDFDPIFFFL
jgi:hypothetical protein